jgi:hypothetical protein
MSNKYYYNFDIVIECTDDKVLTEEQIKNIHAVFDPTFSEYTCQLQHNEQKKIILKACCHSKVKSSETILLKHLKAVLSPLSVNIQHRTGHHAYLHGCNELKSSNVSCSKSWKKGEQHQIHKVHQLWTHMQQTNTNYIEWVTPMSKIDPNNTFLIEALQQNVFVHLHFTSVSKLMFDVFQKPPHSFYVVDFRLTKINLAEEKKLHDTLDEIRRGFIRGSYKQNSFDRIQSTASIWCFADQPCYDNHFYHEFDLVRKRSQDESKEQKQTKRQKL